MCKDQLIRAIASKTGVKQATVKLILEEFQEAVAESLTMGEKVILQGFGAFEIKSRSPRIGRNPHTDEPVEIPARVLPGFTPAEALKNRISGKSSAKKADTKSPRTSPAK